MQPDSLSRLASERLKDETLTGMKTVWQGRMVQAAGKYGEHAPMAAVCCNACRTCATTNAVSLAFAAAGGAGIAVWAAAKRLARRG
jgi:hypothetical protein